VSSKRCPLLEFFVADVTPKRKIEKTFSLEIIGGLKKFVEYK
jgi:hypothetical protein